MGRPKAFLPWGKETFLAEVLRALKENGLRAPVIVTNEELADRIAGAAPRSPVVINRELGRGQFHSLLLGLRRLEEEGGAAGALLLLIDHPGALRERVGILLKEALRDPAAILVAAHDGRPGHPLYLPGRVWGELHAWRGPDGLRGFLTAKGGGRLVETGRAETLRDLDTPEEYGGAAGELMGGPEP